MNSTILKPGMPGHAEAVADFHRKLGEAYLANVDAIARIVADEDLALLIVNPGGPTAEAAARQMGWQGRPVEVVRMSRSRAARIADQIHAMKPDDRAAIEWLRRRFGPRMFVFFEAATFCYDLTPDGPKIVPGTLDEERWA